MQVQCHVLRLEWIDASEAVIILNPRIVCEQVCALEGQRRLQPVLQAVCVGSHAERKVDLRLPGAGVCEQGQAHVWSKPCACLLSAYPRTPQTALAVRTSRASVLSSSRKHNLELIPYLNAWLHMNARMPQVREVETMLQDIKVSDELVAQ